MTLKTRLVTTISMFFLVVALLITGVWAASSANVNIGGTVSFNATNIYATITGKIEGASTTPTLSPLNYSAKSNPGTTELNTWKQNLTFADATIPTIKWTVTIENKSERALYVTLTDNIATLSNATKTLTFDNGSADGEKTIPAKTTKVYTMEIKVTDTNASASVDYDFTFDLKDANAPKPYELKQDDKGFYVIMGHTDTISEIKWRLVGLDGNKFTGSTAPTNGTGTFILETNLSKYIAFESTNSHNDYLTSTVRNYLNGECVTEHNLANDATYNAIVERSVADMYTDIGWNYSGKNSSYAENTVYSIATANTESDKLWLMSVAEIYTIVGGGVVGTDGVIGTDWSAYYENLNWDSTDYWLRTPRSDRSDRAFFVGNHGGWNYDDVDLACAVRPAFNLEF